MKIIGITGYARSGKDSLFEAIKKVNEEFELNLKIKRLAFADALKELVDPLLKESLGISAFETDTCEKTKIRPALIGFGEAARNVDPNFWLNKTKGQIKNLRSEGETDLVVITDVRYPNEAKAIQDLGGALIIGVIKKGNLPACKEEQESVNEVMKMADRKVELLDFNSIYEEDSNLLSSAFSIEAQSLLEGLELSNGPMPYHSA